MTHMLRPLALWISVNSGLLPAVGASSTSENKGECVDQDERWAAHGSNCEKMKRLCDDAGFGQLVRKWCPRSCGLCEETPSVEVSRSPAPSANESSTLPRTLDKDRGEGGSTASGSDASNASLDDHSKNASNMSNTSGGNASSPVLQPTCPATLPTFTPIQAGVSMSMTESLVEDLEPSLEPTLTSQQSLPAAQAKSKSNGSILSRVRSKTETYLRLRSNASERLLNSTNGSDTNGSTLAPELLETWDAAASLSVAPGQGLMPVLNNSWRVLWPDVNSTIRESELFSDVWTKTAHSDTYSDYDSSLLVNESANESTGVGARLIVSGSSGDIDTEKRGGCPDGYEQLVGFVHGGDQWTGNRESYANSLDDCGMRCIRTPGCGSFEFSPSNKKCFRNTQTRPTSDNQRLDFIFCRRLPCPSHKTKEACVGPDVPAGYYSEEVSLRPGSYCIWSAGACQAPMACSATDCFLPDGGLPGMELPPSQTLWISAAKLYASMGKSPVTSLGLR